MTAMINSSAHEERRCEGRAPDEWCTWSRFDEMTSDVNPAVVVTEDVGGRIYPGFAK